MLIKTRFLLKLFKITGLIGFVVCMLLITGLAVSLGACTFVSPQISASPQRLDQSIAKINSLSVSPPAVDKGGSVTITAQVSNISPRSGVYDAVLRINNAPVAVRAVTISAGVTETINFIVPASNVGIYEAEFEGFKGKYTVNDRATQVLQSSNIGNDIVAPIQGTASCCVRRELITHKRRPGGASSPSCCGTSVSPQASPEYSSVGGGCCGR